MNVFWKPSRCGGKGLQARGYEKGLLEAMENQAKATRNEISTVRRQAKVLNVDIGKRESTSR